MDYEIWIIVLVPLIIVIGVISIAYGIGRVVCSWLFRKNALQTQASKMAGFICAIIAATFIGHLIYQALYPPDGSCALISNQSGKHCILHC